MNKPFIVAEIGGNHGGLANRALDERASKLE